VKNYDKMEEFIKTRIETNFKEPKIIHTDMYKMSVNVDYNSLLTKLHQSKIYIT
jgi:hypothetical protein